MLTYINQDRIVAIVQSQGAQPAECPDYIPNTASAKDKQLCFRSSKPAVDLANGIIDALPAKPGADLRATLGWTIEEGAQTNDGCDVDIISNEEPYVYLKPEAPGNAGGCMFWIMERSRCNDGALVVLLM